MILELGGLSIFFASDSLSETRFEHKNNTKAIGMTHSAVSVISERDKRVGPNTLPASQLSGVDAYVH